MKAFLVCFQNRYKDLVYFLLNRLPDSWNEGIPTYDLAWLIDSVIVGDTKDEENFKWRVAGSDCTSKEYFEYQHVEPGDCYQIELDEDKKTLQFDYWIGRYSTDTGYQENKAVASETQSTDHSDCEFAGDADPSDIGAYEEDTPAEVPALTHAYLVCHKIDGKKRYVLMWELPISWTPLDTFYYHESDIIERVVPGTKYSFTSLNMSAYAYGEEYMQPGDIISCAIVGNRIDRFVRIDRYLVRCATREVAESDAEGSNIVDEVNESVDQLLEEAPKPVQTPCYLVWYKKDGEYRGAFLTEIPKEIHCDYEFPDDIVIDYLTEDSDYYYINHEKGDAYRYAKVWLGVDDCYLVMFFPDDKYHIGYFTRQYKETSDNVNHPSHYTLHPSGVECIEITKHHDFCIGNAIKYLWRQGLKQSAGKSIKDKQIEDLKKAIWYINKKIEMLEGE